MKALFSKIAPLSVLLAPALSLAQPGPCTSQQLQELSSLPNILSNPALIQNLVAEVQTGTLRCSYSLFSTDDAAPAVCGGEVSTLSSYDLTRANGDDSAIPTVWVTRARTTCAPGETLSLAGFKTSPRLDAQVTGSIARASGVTIQYRTGGCTEKSDIQLVAYSIKSNGRTRLVLQPYRVKPDLCRALITEEYTYTWAELGISPPADPSEVSVPRR